MVRLRVLLKRIAFCGANLEVVALRQIQVKSYIILGRQLRCGMTAMGGRQSFPRLVTVVRGETAMCPA